MLRKTVLWYIIITGGFAFISYSMRKHSGISETYPETVVDTIILQICMVSAIFGWAAPLSWPLLLGYLLAKRQV